MGLMLLIPFLVVSLTSKLTNTQDIECKSPLTCTQVLLAHSVQVKTHCVYSHILFRNMSETTLPVGMFRLCRQTLILDMSNNNINTIKAGAFLGLSSLQQLYLANNQIERIEPGTFHTLTTLEVFVLTGNRITTIPEYEFTSKAMQFFNINNNRIERLPSSALVNLQTPELIDLSLNQLDSINAFTFANVQPGVKIVLNNNRLKHLAIQFNFTTETPNNKNNKNNKKGQLTSILEASGNMITSLSSSTLGDFYKLRLSSLDLSFNFILDIHVETFDNYTTLKSLYLSHNRLKSIPLEMFRMLTNLNSLDLSFNKLTQTVFDVALPEGIMALNYSNNRIERFPEYHWSSKVVRQEMVLDISNNSIDYLDANRFCTAISRVNIANNHWRCRVLYGIVHTLEMRGIHVEKGSDFVGDNVIGISCKIEQESGIAELDVAKEMLKQSQSEFKSNSNESTLIDQIDHDNKLNGMNGMNFRALENSGSDFRRNNFKHYFVLYFSLIFTFYMLKY